MEAADASHPSAAGHLDPRDVLPRGLRSARWRGREDIVVLIARDAMRGTSAHDVQAATDLLHDQGAVRVITGALHDHELGPYLAAGYEPHEQLHLLEHPLTDLPRVPPITARLRRGRRTDHDPALEVDSRCFDAFWRLDQAGLEDAIRATTAARFRVAVDTDVVGYAVTGRSGGRGYLQRLAVDPARQGRGIGRALVLDGLHWLARRRAQVAVVNTQVGNDGALELYRRLGFRLLPNGLTVLLHVRPEQP